MKRYPFPILFVALALIIAGTVGLFYHLQDFANLQQKMYVTILVECLRIVAIISGALLLKAYSAGKWLAIGWVLLHVIISTFNTLDETLVHIGVLVIVIVLLFLPASSAYFKTNKKNSL